MNMLAGHKWIVLAAAILALFVMGGCAGMEYNKKQNKYPWLYIHKELPAADRAVEAARQAGKERECPEAFKAVEDLKNSAYDAYAACRTREAQDMARDAASRAQALCPPVPQKMAEPQEEPLVPLPEPAPTPGHYKYCITLDIEFDIDKADIRSEYNDEIAKVGDFMKKYPTTTAVIEGHTDNVGTAEHNLALSQRRAESVVNALVEKFGIERTRLSAKGYGLTKPVADNATSEGRQKNRRIEAIIDCAIVDKEIKPPNRLCVYLDMEFDTGKADIKDKYRSEIAKVGEFMQKYPTTTAVIEGHTDNVGGYDFNMKLSQQRAESVVNYLVQNFQIERSRLSAKGYGYTRRVAYNTTPEGRQKNRRINAIIDCVIR